MIASAPLMERGWWPPWRTLAPPALLVASWPVLFWLSRRPLGAGLPAPALGPWYSTALTLLVVVGAPGFCLWRLLGRPRSWVEDAAFSFGLGLAFLLAFACPILFLHSNVHVLTSSVTAGSGVLVVLETVRRWRLRGASGRRVPGPRFPTLLVLASLLAVLLAVSGSARGFTFGGDEWFYMRAVRQFLDASAISDTMMLDAWSFVLALVVKLAGLELIDAYQTQLLPFLVTGAALCFLALAKEVLRSWSGAALAFALQALLCLSDMQTRGEGAGMALLSRLIEDKYAGLLIAAPLALASLLAFLRSGHRGVLAACVVLSLAAVILQPLALFWIGLPASVLLAFAWWRSGERRPGWIVAAAVLATAALTLAWAQRALRPAASFVLYAPEWPFNARLLALSRRQLYILSLERGWFMAHVDLLLHPLTLCALAATVLLVPLFGRSLSSRFLVAGMALPVLLAYNPLTATALGRWIMPWMVYRLLWALPVALVLAAVLGNAVRRAGRWTGGSRAGPPGWALAALVAVIAGLLAPRIGLSWRALEARNRVFVSAGEREVLRFAAAAAPARRGQVLAPRGVSARLSAWSSTLQGCPGLDAVRSPDEHAAEISDCRRLLKAHSVDERFVATLGRRGITYIVAPTGSALDRALLPWLAFQPLFRGGEYTFYAWRPERWPAKAAS